jgi:hypothetical protein
VSALLRRVALPIAVAALVAGSGLPAFALTVNPIDPALPLSIHTRSTCLNGTVSFPGNVGNTTLHHVDREFGGNCTGGVTQQNPATLTGLLAESRARSDLGAGTIGAVALSRSFVDEAQALRVGTQASASIYDTLTVNGTWAGVRNVEIRLVVQGKLTSNAPAPNWMSSDVSTGLLLINEAGFLLANTGVFINQGNDGTPFITSTAASGGANFTTNAVNQVFDPDDVRVTLSFVFPATTSSRTFSFRAQLNLSSGMGFVSGLQGAIVEGMIDFADAGRFELIVPADVTVSSASGRFLSGVPAPQIPIFPSTSPD